MKTRSSTTCGFTELYVADIQTHWLVPELESHLDRPLLQPGPNDEAHGAHWEPIHYYPPKDATSSGSVSVRDETAYVYYKCDEQKWAKSCIPDKDDEKSECDNLDPGRYDIRPKRRYGHATAMYTTNAQGLLSALERSASPFLTLLRHVAEMKGLTSTTSTRFDGCLPGVTNALKDPTTTPPSPYTSEYRERAAARGVALDGVAADPVSFMFLFGGHDGKELLDDLWCRSLDPKSDTRSRGDFYSTTLVSGSSILLETHCVLARRQTSPGTA